MQKSLLHCHLTFLETKACMHQKSSNVYVRYIYTTCFLNACTEFASLILLRQGWYLRASHVFFLNCNQVFYILNLTKWLWCICVVYICFRPWHHPSQHPKERLYWLIMLTFTHNSEVLCAYVPKHCMDAWKSFNLSHFSLKLKLPELSVIRADPLNILCLYVGKL